MRIRGKMEFYVYPYAVMQLRNIMDKARKYQCIVDMKVSLIGHQAYLVNISLTFLQIVSYLSCITTRNCTVGDNYCPGNRMLL